MRPLKGFFAAPVRDYLALVDGLAQGRPAHWLWLLLGMVAGWWIYVPVHELLHALGCLATGGEITQLEIAEVYGGGLLAAWIPWVSAGSDYAGQLTGFDTKGNDFIYLSTVLLPYLLTVFPGVWMVRRLIAPPRASASLVAGLGLSAALAPFISLSGDLYEAGSILVTGAIGLGGDMSAQARYRSDDLFLLIDELAASEATLDAWLIVAGSAMVGVVLAFFIYALGSALASRFVRRRQSTARTRA